MLQSIFSVCLFYIYLYSYFFSNGCYYCIYYISMTLQERSTCVPHNVWDYCKHTRISSRRWKLKQCFVVTFLWYVQTPKNSSKVAIVIMYTAIIDGRNVARPRTLCVQTMPRNETQLSVTLCILGTSKQAGRAVNVTLITCIFATCSIHLWEILLCKQNTVHRWTVCSCRQISLRTKALLCKQKTFAYDFSLYATLLLDHLVNNQV